MESASKSRATAGKAKAKIRVKPTTVKPKPTTVNVKAKVKVKSRTKATVGDRARAVVGVGRQAGPEVESGVRRRRRPSRTRAAVRARRRRRDERGVRDQIAHERQEARERATARRRERRRGARPGPPDERRRAIGWLEEIRNVVASVFRCSLDVTEAVSSSKEDEEDDDPGAIRQRENMRTPWLVVGRFDPQEPIGYVELAHALHLVQRDLTLEVAINPQRLSQIRIVYADPNSRRGEGDSVVSKIGAWEFILSDVVTEIMGSGTEDAEALAVRYQETRIPKFYLYFSTNTGIHVTGSGQAFRWAKI